METITNSNHAPKYNAKALLTKIKAVGKTIAKVREHVQDYGLDACRHAVQHGDTSLLTALVGQMEGMNRTSFLTWLMIHFPMSEVEAKQGYVFNGKTKRIGLAKDWKTADWNFQAASEMNWWQAKPETEAQPFDVAKAIASLFARIENAHEKGKEIKGMEDGKVRSFLNIFGAKVEDFLDTKEETIEA